MLRILFILLICCSTFSQSATATCRASATIIDTNDIELDSLGEFKLDKYGQVVFKADALSKYIMPNITRVPDIKVGMHYTVLFEFYGFPMYIISMPNGKKKLIYDKSVIYLNKDGYIDIIRWIN